MSGVKALIVPFSCSQRVRWIANSNSEQNCKRATVKNLKQCSFHFKCDTLPTAAFAARGDIFHFYLFMKPNFCRFPGFMFGSAVLQ